MPPAPAVTHAKLLDWIVPGLLAMVVALLGWLASNTAEIKEQLAANAVRQEQTARDLGETKERVRNLEVVVFQRLPLPVPEHKP